MWVETEDEILDPKDPRYAQQQREMAEYLKAKAAGIDVDSLER